MQPLDFPLNIWMIAVCKYDYGSAGAIGENILVCKRHYPGYGSDIHVALDRLAINVEYYQNTNWLETDFLSATAAPMELAEKSNNTYLHNCETRGWTFHG